MKNGDEPGSADTVADGGTESYDTSTDGIDSTERSANSGSEIQRPELMNEEAQEFLLEAVRRGPLLQSLQSGAADASELSESVDASRSTIHRALKNLQEEDIVTESDDAYELTSLGEIIAQKIAMFGTQASTAMTLKQFLNSINMNGNGIPIEHFVDATITRRKSRQPHATIHRIFELFENSDSLRMFSTVLSPVYVDLGYQEMMDGMEIEAIFDREVIDIMLSKYPEKANETIATGNFEVYAHDGLPFELFIFDDKIGMAAHNENGNAEVLIECEDATAIEWAENLHAKHLSNAKAVLAYDS